MVLLLDIAFGLLNRNVVWVRFPQGLLTMNPYEPPKCSSKRFCIFKNRLMSNFLFILNLGVCSIFMYNFAEVVNMQNWMLMGALLVVFVPGICVSHLCYFIVRNCEFNLEKIKQNETIRDSSSNNPFSD